MRWLISLLLFPAIGFSSIAFDLYSYNTSTAVNMNLTHTVTGTNNIVLVGLAYQYPAPSVVSMNYGGYALTPIAVTASGGTSAEKRGNSAMYYLINPPTGLQALSVTVSGSGPRKVLWVQSFSGVDQDFPIRFSATSAGQLPSMPSSTVSVVSGDMAVVVAQLSSQNVLAKESTLGIQTFSVSTTGISVTSIRRAITATTDLPIGFTAPSGTAYWTAIGVTLAQKDLGLPTPYIGVTAYQGSAPWTFSLTGQPPTTIQGNVAVTNTQLSVSNLGSSTPSYMSLEVSTAGATVIIPSDTLSLRWHLSGDSGATGYIYSSLVSINNAKLDTGDSCGYLSFGVGANVLPINIPCNPFEDMRLSGPINMYFYSKGTADAHLVLMRKIQ